MSWIINRKPITSFWLKIAAIIDLVLYFDLYQGPKILTVRCLVTFKFRFLISYKNSPK